MTEKKWSIDKDHGKPVYTLENLKKWQKAKKEKK